MEKINLREERDFGQKISATFLFLQQNFGPLFKSLLYYAGPVSLLAGVFMGLYQSLNLNAEDLAGRGDAFQFLFESVFNINYILALLLSTLSRVIVIGITFAYLAEYLENPREEIRPGAVWSRLGDNFLRLFFTSLAYVAGMFLVALVVGVISSLSFFGTIPTDMDAILPRVFLVPLMGLLVIVPVIFFAVRFCLFPAVIFIEDKGGVASLKRSWKLVKGKWWSTFGLVIVISIIVSIIGVAFQIPLLLIAFFKEILQWESGGSNQMIIIVASVIGILGETMLYSIVNLAMGFQYFNLSERQESIGLMQEIDSLGRKAEFNSNEGDY